MMSFSIRCTSLVQDRPFKVLGLQQVAIGGLEKKVIQHACCPFLRVPPTKESILVGTHAFKVWLQEMLYGVLVMPT